MNKKRSPNLKEIADTEKHGSQRSMDSPGQRLKAARQKLGKKQFELAAAAGINPMFISLAETGRLRLRPAEAEALAKVLGIDPDELLEAQPA
jgi:transcriptional regulator with XRE-family HTH domain